MWASKPIQVEIITAGPQLRCWRRSLQGHFCKVDLWPPRKDRKVCALPWIHRSEINLNTSHCSQVNCWCFYRCTSSRLPLLLFYSYILHIVLFAQYFCTQTQLLLLKINTKPLFWLQKLYFVQFALNITLIRVQKTTFVPWTILFPSNGGSLGTIIIVPRS